MVQNISVLGGGAVAHSIAGQLTLKGYRITLCNLPIFRQQIDTVLKNKTIKMTGKVEATATIHKATTDIAEGIKDAELIFLASPAYKYEAFMDSLIPSLRKGQKIVTTGANYFPILLQKKLKEKGIQGVTVGDTNMCPMGGRMLGPGEVTVTKRPSLQIAAFPSKDTPTLMQSLNPVVDNVGTAARDVIETALNNLGPMAHPSGMILNAGTIEFAFMENREYFLYREGISPGVANVVDGVDQERLSVAREMGYTPETLVEELGGGKTVYEVFRGPRFMNSTGPKGFKDRYLIEDLPYGLVPLSGLGKIVRKKTPLTDAIVTLASKLVGKDFWTEGVTLRKLGLEGLTLQQLKNFLAEGFR